MEVSTPTGGPLKRRRDSGKAADQLSPAVGDGVRAAELADAFGAAAKLMGRLLTERLERHGDSMPRFRLLVELAQRGPARLTDLANRVGASQGPTSAHIDVLVRDGLVERATDPGDKRATVLAVTSDGRRRAGAWLRDYEAAAADLFAGLPQDQWPLLKSILDTLTSSNSLSTSR
jgi:DNA-binding MarR family transcriptional regulator